MEIKSFTLNENHREDLEFLLSELSGKKRALNLDNHQNVYCIGAFESNTLVGFAQLFILPKTTFTIGHLEDVIVHPEYRNQGIGKRLVEEVISIAKQKNASVINLTTREERGAALSLFESLGFTHPSNMTFRLRLEPED